MDFEFIEKMGNDSRVAQKVGSEGVEAHAASASGEERFEERRPRKATRTHLKIRTRKEEEETKITANAKNARKHFRAHQESFLS